MNGLLTLTDRTVISRVFAFGAGPFEVDSTDATGVVGVRGQIPFPLGHSVEGFDGHFHLSGALGGDSLYSLEQFSENENNFLQMMFCIIFC